MVSSGCLTIVFEVASDPMTRQRESVSSGALRWQVCLAYWHYMVYGSLDYAESSDIHRRLQSIGYKPSLMEEYSGTLDKPENDMARSIYNRLLRDGYRRRDE